MFGTTEPGKEIDRLCADIEQIVSSRVQEWLKSGATRDDVRARLMTVATHSCGEITAMVACTDQQPAEFYKFSYKLIGAQVAEWGSAWIATGRAKPVRLAQ